MARVLHRANRSRATRVCAVLGCLLIAACDPTDPDNNGFHYYVVNDTSAPVTVLWCYDHCAEAHVVARGVAPGDCADVRVGNSELNSGSEFEVQPADKVGKDHETFGYIDQPQSGLAYPASQTSASMRVAYQHPLTAFPARCRTGAK